MSKAFHISNTKHRVQAIKQLLRMSMFIERYSSQKRLGISILNGKLMDPQFYFNLMTEGIIYFILVVKTLEISKT